MSKRKPKKFTPAEKNRTVRLTRDLIKLGEGKPEIGIATNRGVTSKGVTLYRSGSGWVGEYPTVDKLGNVTWVPVPINGLTAEQNEKALEAGASFYRGALYDRYPKFAAAMPSEAMAVQSDVFHHNRQENTKSPVWDKDNEMVWNARTGDKATKEAALKYLKDRGYKGTDFNEVAARQLLDYTTDSGVNHVYKRAIQRFNVLAPKLGKNSRPWDYIDPKWDEEKRRALTDELKKAWVEVNGAQEDTVAPTQGAMKGGDVEGDQVTEIEESVSESEDSDTDVTEGGPRIVINPTTFKNQKDALCVAFNERFRIWMEQHGFEPTSEPTDKQRKFFSDTAYADDETQLRRTILARIATLDTSIEDPTDDQILETLSMLKDFQKTEQAENEWESTALDRLIKLVLAAAPIAEPKLVDGDVPSVRMEQVEEAPI